MSREEQREWYVADAGGRQIAGPLTATQLRTRAQHGLFPEGALVAKSGGNGWQTLREALAESAVETARWFVAVPGGQSVGPITTEVLRRGLEAGRVPRDALVCREGEERWRALEEEVEFAGLALDAMIVGELTIAAPIAGTATAKPSAPVPTRTGPPEGGSRPSVHLVGTASTSTKAAPPPRRRWLWTAGALGVLVTAGLAVFLVVWTVRREARRQLFAEVAVPLKARLASTEPTWCAAHLKHASVREARVTPMLGLLDPGLTVPLACHRADDDRLKKCLAGFVQLEVATKNTEYCTTTWCSTREKVPNCVEVRKGSVKDHGEGHVEIHFPCGRYVDVEVHDVRFEGEDRVRVEYDAIVQRPPELDVLDAQCGRVDRATSDRRSRTAVLLKQAGQWTFPGDAPGG